MRVHPQRAFSVACLLFVAGASVASADIFEPLFTATRVIGNVQVVRPGRAPEPMRLDHAYPYGTRIIVPDEMTMTNGAPAAASEVRIDLARDFRFRLGQGTDVTVEDLSVGEGDDLSEVKRFDLRSGSVFTYITANTQKTGGGLGDALVDKNLAAIVIKTPLGECTRLAQRNEVRVDPGEGGACSATFTTQSGMMEVFGPQYSIKNMSRNASVVISGTKEQTSILTANGEFDIAFEKGVDAEERARFRARFLGKIWRQYADVGGRMAVAVMIYYPRGNGYEMKSYNYLEGQKNVGMWTSVAAAVSGEHNALAVSDELAAANGGATGGDEGGDSEWNPDDGGDEGDDDGWNPDEAGDDGGGDVIDDGDSFDFGW